MGLIYIALKNIFVQREKYIAFFLTISLSITLILLLIFISSGIRTNLKKGSEEIKADYTVKMESANLKMTYRGIPVGQQGARELTALPLTVPEYFKSFPPELKLISFSFRKVNIIMFRGTEIITVGYYTPAGIPPGEQTPSAGYKLKSIPELPGSIINLPGLGDVRINNILDKTGTENDNIILYPVKELPEADIIKFTSQLTSVQEIKKVLTDRLPEDVKLLEISGSSKENDLRFSFFGKLINYLAYLILIMIFPILLLFNVFGLSIIRGRERDIAVLRVVGFRKKDIGKLIFIELAFIGTTSSLAGIVFSIPLVFLVQNSGVLPGFAVSDVNIPLITGTSFITASVILSLSGLIPVSRASALDPVTAFRAIN